MDDPISLPRCDVCFETVQSDDDLTMCMDCGCDYCPNCGAPNLHQDAMGTCMDCRRSKGRYCLDNNPILDIKETLMTRKELEDRVAELERENAALRSGNVAQALEPHEPDITIQELANMDGAGGSNSAFVLYPVPVAKQVELLNAIKIANNGTMFSGNQRIAAPVELSDFNYTAFEEHHQGLVDQGTPQYLAFKHKRTGKSQAGFAYNDPGHPKQLATAVTLTELAVPDPPSA